MLEMYILGARQQNRKSSGLEEGNDFILWCHSMEREREAALAVRFV